MIIALRRSYDEFVTILWSSYDFLENRVPGEQGTTGNARHEKASRKPIRPTQEEDKFIVLSSTAKPL